MFIYCIRNKINDKKYIGYDSHPIGEMRRWRDHQKFGDDTSHTFFYNALRKYGIENFEYSVIDTADNIEELKQKEIFHIAKHRSFEEDFGYNMTPGGDGHTKESHDKWFYSLPEERQNEILEIRRKNLTVDKNDKEAYEYFIEQLKDGCQFGWDRLSEEERAERTRNHTCRFKHQELEGKEREEYFKEYTKKWKEWFYAQTPEEKEEYGRNMSAIKTGIPNSKIAINWLVVKEDGSIIVALGYNGLKKIFNNMTSRMFQSRATKCKNNPSNFYDGFRIIKINIKEAFHYTGIQFCRPKINTIH